MRSAVLFYMGVAALGCSSAPDSKSPAEVDRSSVSSKARPSAKAAPPAPPIVANSASGPAASATSPSSAADSAPKPAGRADGRCARCQRDGETDPIQWNAIVWTGDTAQINEGLEAIMLDAAPLLFECANDGRSAENQAAELILADSVRVEGRKVTHEAWGNQKEKSCRLAPFAKVTWPEGDYAVLMVVSVPPDAFQYSAPKAEQGYFKKVGLAAAPLATWGAPGSADKRTVGKVPVAQITVPVLDKILKRRGIHTPIVGGTPEAAFFWHNYAFSASGRSVGPATECWIGAVKVSGPNCKAFIEELVFDP